VTEAKQATLTAKQAAIRDYIRDHSLISSPTYRQIARAFGYRSPNAVAVHVKALERKGAIRKTSSRAGGLEVVHADGE